MSTGYIDARRSRSLIGIPASAGIADTRGFQRFERFDEPRNAPVKDMIVGEDAAIHPSCRQTPDVLWVHFIVDAFVGNVPARRDARLEIDDPRMRRSTLHCRKRVAPHVSLVDRPWNRTVRAFGEFDVISGITNP